MKKPIIKMSAGFAMFAQKLVNAIFALDYNLRKENELQRKRL